MGGPAGHMAHPYENLDLTFGQLQEMLLLASQGFPKLKVTEKTDGQNIAISYDHQSGKAIAVRNKGHVVEGGRDKDALKAYFTTERTNPPDPKKKPKDPAPDNVVDSFYDAMGNFEKVAQMLPPEFFITPEGERIFYNAEVMDPRSANVLDYDTQVLLIHRAGHKKRVIGEKGPELQAFSADIAEDYATELEARISELQETSPEISTVKVNAIVDFANFIEKKDAYREAVNELRVEQGRAGHPETIRGYLENRILSLLADKIGTNYTDETHQLILKALIHYAEEKSPPVFRDYVKPVLDSVPEPEKKAFIKDFMWTAEGKKAMKALIDRAIRPLIMINHRFATKLLEGFVSGYTVQSDVSLEKLRKKVGAKAKELTDPGDLSVLKTSLAKIHGGEDVEDVLDDSALEFDYDGMTYKFTGQFAPVNQMLGLGKYDRGSKETVSEAMEYEAEDTIGLVPMAAKPYHAGHHALIELAAKQNDKVIVFVSTSDRERKGEFSISGADMKRIWKEEIEKVLPSNVMPIYGGSPVRNVYDLLGQANEEGGGTKYTIYSDPDDTKLNYPVCNRIKYFSNLYDSGLVQCIAEISPEKVTRGVGTPDISGTKLRAALGNNDFEMFAASMPAGVDAKKVFDTLRGVQEQKKSLSLLYSLVESALEEKRKKKTKVSKAGQKRVSKKIGVLIGKEKKDPKQAAAIAYSMEKRGKLKKGKKHSVEEMSMAGGSVTGYAGGPIKTPTKNKRDEEDLVGEVLNYLLNIR